MKKLLIVLLVLGSIPILASADIKTQVRNNTKNIQALNEKIASVKDSLPSSSSIEQLKGDIIEAKQLLKEVPSKDTLELIANIVQVPDTLIYLTSAEFKEKFNQLNVNFVSSDSSHSFAEQNLPIVYECMRIVKKDAESRGAKFNIRQFYIEIGWNWRNGHTVKGDQSDKYSISSNITIQKCVNLLTVEGVSY